MMNIEVKKEYKVLIRCMTYNQSNYITRALEGFADQKTTFPYISVIMDDASTDGEQRIIEDWFQKNCKIDNYTQINLPLSKVIIAEHKTNNHCTFAFYLLKENLYKKDKRFFFEPWRKHCLYEALCEGDDYWTDPNKLQRQVDFLDKHPEYSVLAENAVVSNSITNSSYPFTTCPTRDITSMEELILHRKFPTAGVLLRMPLVREMYQEHISLHDTFIWCWMLTKGKIRFDEVISSVYRRGLGGYCEGTEHYAFGKKIEEWDLKLMRYFNIDKNFIYSTIAKIYWYTCKRAFKDRQWKSATKSSIKIIAYLLKTNLFYIFK